MVEQTPAEELVSIVVPVFNSAPTLTDLARRVDDVGSRGYGLELILVNDASRDQSWTTIAALARRYPWVRGVNLASNVGQHNALLCGILSARGAVIVTMDDDLQHPPEEIPRLLDALRDGVDVVYGHPISHSHPAWRVAASWVLSVVMRMGRPGGPPRLSSFRAFPASLRDAFANERSTSVSIDALLSRRARRFAIVSVRHDPRTLGRSSYDLVKLTRVAIATMVGFSETRRNKRPHAGDDTSRPFVVRDTTGATSGTEPCPPV